MGISKEAHDFWKKVTEEHGDNDLVTYMVSANDGDAEYDEIKEVPSEADFLYDADDDYHHPWYEAPTEFEHTYGVEYSSARFTVDEVSSIEFSGSLINTVVDAEDLQEYLGNIEEANNYEIELTEMGGCDQPESDYIAQMYSSEKGTFFEGIIETIGEFDPKKLKIYTTEFLNGEDTVTEVHYDGKEVDNNGGDTNGKGYYASVWAN